MARSTWFKTLIGIVLSLCIAYYVNALLKTVTEQVDVVVASQDIASQTVITSNMLKTIKVNASAQKALTPMAAQNIHDVVGSITLVSRKSGEVIELDATKLVSSTEHVMASGEMIRNDDLPRSYFIPPDKRAITVRVDAEGSLGFSLNKGDVIDVLFTSMSYDTQGTYTTILLERITIFDLDPVTERDRTNINTAMQNITLLVSPKEAQLLSLAKRKGKIDLLLNPLNVEDGSIIPDKPTYPSEFVNH